MDAAGREGVGFSPSTRGSLATDVVPKENRTLPHNAEAERTVLGAVLVDNQAFNSAAEILSRNDFYREAHRRVFDAMAALAERSQPIDLVTLKDELVRMQALEAVGGAAYLAALVDGMPRITNVEQWSRIIKEKAVLRNLIHASNRIAQDAYQAEDEAAFILDRAEKAIFDIAEHRIRQGFVGIREIVKESFRTIDQLSQSKELVTGLPTGFVDLDEKTSGLQKGDLIIVAARPAMGKTSFCLNIAQYAAHKTGETVGIFSLEMAKEQLVLRMLCADARVDAHRLRTGNLQEKDWARLAKAYADLSASKIFIDDSATLTPLEMRAKCRRLKAEHGLGLVIVDYLQLVTGSGRVENRQQEISSISRSMKGLAKELSVPVIALSQLSRAPEARTEKRPQLSDLRESRRHRAGRGHRDVHLPGRGVQGHGREPGAGRDHHRQAAQRAHGHREAGLPQGIHAVRELRLARRHVLIPPCAREAFMRMSASFGVAVVAGLACVAGRRLRSRPGAPIERGRGHAARAQVGPRAARLREGRVDGGRLRRSEQGRAVRRAPQDARGLQDQPALPSDGRERDRHLRHLRRRHGRQVRRRRDEGALPAGGFALMPAADAPLRDGEDGGRRPGPRDGTVRADLREPGGRPEQARGAGGEVARRARSYAHQETHQSMSCAQRSFSSVSPPIVTCSL